MLVAHCRPTVRGSPLCPVVVGNGVRAGRHPPPAPTDRQALGHGPPREQWRRRRRTALRRPVGEKEEYIDARPGSHTPW